MSTALTPEEVDRYHERGVHFPVRVLEPDEVVPLRAAFRALEAREGGRVSASTNLRAHLLLRWVALPDARCAHPRRGRVADRAGHPALGVGLLREAPRRRRLRLVAPGRDLLGPVRRRRGDRLGRAVAEHARERLHARAARLAPRPRPAHRDTFAAGNLLSRGQEIAVEVDERDAVDVVLEAGEMSLHHVLIHHGSGPNRADDDRIGLALRYIPTRLRQTAVPHDTASLVRGTDRFGHFEPEPIPGRDFDPEVVRYHAENAARHRAMLYEGAAARTGARRPAVD